MDERALCGPQIDPPLGVEPLERLAHRLARDPEMAGQLALHEVLAGTESAGGDEFEQRLVDPLTEWTGPLQLRYRAVG